jgi:hypothetical protein
MKKAVSAAEVIAFQQIPNIGPRMQDDFIRLGIIKPAMLAGKDPLKLYHKMCTVSGVRQDPCVLDTYMAAVDFMNGNQPKDWWKFTKERKAKYPNI